MINNGQAKSLGITTGLVLLNIAAMWLLSMTPLAAANSLLFGDFFLIGVVVYGALLTGGVHLAKRGVRRENNGTALAGLGMLQVAYGTFGAGALASVSASLQPVALGITAAATTGIAVLSGLLVFGTDHDFSSWGGYANFIFMGAFGASIVASFAWQFIAVAFLFALVGFIVYLIHQVYVTKQRPGKPFLNGIGLYAAYMGVFVEILQLVIELLVERE